MLKNYSAVSVASISVVVGGAFWGLFWIPVRIFEDLGLTGAWPGLVIYVTAFVLIAPFAFVTKFPDISKCEMILVGILTGAAFTFYGTAIILTDVLRALLLFYLTPVWGTAIGVIFLGEKLSFARVLAIILALGGLLTVVGFGSRPSINLGDIMALCSGIFWAIGTFKIYKIGKIPAVHLSVAFLLGSIIITLGLILLGGDALGERAEFPPIRVLWPYVLLCGMFAVPMILLTIWPASVLTPGRMGILLMSEVVVGVVSVAIFAGEPFGSFEALGAVLIVTAAFTEVIGNRN